MSTPSRWIPLALVPLLTLIASCRSSHAQVRVERLPSPASTASADASLRTPERFRPDLLPPRAQAQGGFERRVLYLPSGQRASSTVALERVSPPLVEGNEEFVCTLRITNLTPNPLADVRVTERLDTAFRLTRTEPPADVVTEAIAAWTFAHLEPNASHEIRIWGRSAKGGELEHLTEVDFRPLLRSTTRVEAPKLKLFVNAPTEVLACDPIPVRFHVTNVGETDTDTVRIDDVLPDGLVTVDGDTNLRAEFPSLLPGESRSQVVRLIASEPGTDLFRARTGSAFGHSAVALPVEIVVRAPELEVELAGPDEVYWGTPLAFELRVANVGDGLARTGTVAFALPADAAFRSATEGGRLIDGEVRWNLSDFAPGQEFAARVVWTALRPGSSESVLSARVDCRASEVRSVTSSVLEEPELTLDVALTGGGQTVRSGDELELVLLVSNFADEAAEDVQLEVDLDEGFEVTEVVGPGARMAEAGASFEPLEEIEPGTTARWRILLRARASGDPGARVVLRADALPRPLEREVTATVAD